MLLRRYHKKTEKIIEKPIVGKPIEVEKPQKEEVKKVDKRRKTNKAKK